MNAKFYLLFSHNSHFFQQFFSFLSNFPSEILTNVPWRTGTGSERKFPSGKKRKRTHMQIIAGNCGISNYKQDFREFHWGFREMMHRVFECDCTPETLSQSQQYMTEWSCLGHCFTWSCFWILIPRSYAMYTLRTLNFQIRVSLKIENILNLFFFSFCGRFLSIFRQSFFSDHLNVMVTFSCPSCLLILTIFRQQRDCSK